MIRSSALLTVAALAMLVAGAFSASLGLIYASIAVSILAAGTLGAGVLLRRREIFGEAGAGDTGPGWAAGDVAGARPAARGPEAGMAAAGTAGAGSAADRPRAGRGGRSSDRQEGGERRGGDLAERPRKAKTGTAGPG